MLYKTCCYCKRKLKLNEKCSRCSKIRNEVYDKNSRDKEAQVFYNSRDWKLTRKKVMSKYNYLDLYALKVLGKLVQADVVHHIVEFREDKSKALDVSNLIPLSHQSHNLIHALYDKSKQSKNETIQLLKKLLQM
ncbi:endonuclease [Pseudostreptobacillus hongkongensis]|uniref:hypothetical protein n=1 Tax=Pseudostreptobacillus hongkongensis TaxID=1162717 RepID=UPI000833E4EF